MSKTQLSPDARSVKGKFPSVILFVFLFLATTGIFSSSAQTGKPIGDAFYTCPKCNNRWSGSAGQTVCPKCGFGGRNPTPPSVPTPDYEAERRQQEAERAAVAAAAEAERLRLAEANRIKAEADKRQADFIRMRDETVTLLKDAGGNSGLKGLNEYGLKDAGGNSASPNNSGLKGVNEYGLKDAGDPKVVNAQNVPSGLPKAVENAIAEAYPDAPPGVSDRVRKGFQAVMTSDWKVAKAWFQDALNRDPGNVGIQRLILLTDNSLARGAAPATAPPASRPPTGEPGKSTQPVLPEIKMMEDLISDLLWKPMVAEKSPDKQPPPSVLGDPFTEQQLRQKLIDGDYEKQLRENANKRRNDATPNWKAFFQDIFGPPPKGKAKPVSSARG